MPLADDVSPQVDEPTATDDPDARTRPPARLPWIVAVVLAVVAAGAVAVAVFEPFEPAPPTAAEAVVREGSSLLLELDSADAEEIRPQLEALAAGQFRDELDRAFSAGLSDVLAAANTNAEAEVTRVFLDASPAGAVSAISVSEVTRSGPELPEPTTFQAYLQLELLRVDGEWRIVEVADLGIGRGGAPAPTPTGTPAPSPEATSDPSPTPSG